MDISDPNLKLDADGICERCRQYYREILPLWQKGEKKESELVAIVNKIKKEGQGKKYDCILGISGGLDSSFMLHYAVKELKLRPLVFHVDGGWDMPFAVDNIKKITNKLNIDLKIEKIDWEEMRDFQLAFFKSGVPYVDTPQDHAFVATLYNYADEHNIKYILNGGNISTEVVVNPNAWGYWGTDMVFLRDIIKKYCKLNLKKYPFSSVIRHKVYLRYIRGIQVIRLLNSIPYVKKDAESLLVREYDWIPYQQKHFESILTKFFEGYWKPIRFGYDVRRPQYSSLILTGQMTREEALNRLSNPSLSPEEVEELTQQVCEKLEISREELNNYFTMPKKTFKDYKHQRSVFILGAKIMYLLKIDKLIRK